MTDEGWRRLGEADWEALVALEQASPVSQWTTKQLRDALLDPAVCVIGGECPGGLVAHAVVARLPFEAELQSLLVAPGWRRQGLATALLTAVVATAREWRSERLLLEVRAGNGGAIALYRRAGFLEEGRRRGYYPPLERGAQREDALLMSLPLR